VSESSRADLLRQLDALGTNLLVVSPGRSVLGDNATLPYDATAMASRIAPVEKTASVSDTGSTVRRSSLIDARDTSGLAVYAASLGLPETVDAKLADGSWLNAATSRYPAVVLGAKAAERLGISSVATPVSVWIGDQSYVVVGILETLPLNPELDRSVLIGESIAHDALGSDLAPTLLYVRTTPDRVEQVRSVLPRTANPEHPEQVNVNRPSDALKARAAAKTTFRSLFIGLGAIALLVGAIGVANVMIISVLERRREIGVRRAIGAKRVHVAGQFLMEASLLAVIGGALGVAMGIAVAAAYARSQAWPLTVPTAVVGGAFVLSLAIGAIAGVYPAVRAARLAPTEALRTT
jgi:putative ABC transport system permease protein